MPRAMSGAQSHAGQRDKLITIERLKSEPTSGSNFPVETFGQPMQFWASREFVSLSEGMNVGQLSTAVIQRWQIPYSSEMDPDLVNVPKERRIVYQSRIYDIQSAEMLDSSEGMEIILTTLGQAG